MMINRFAEKVIERLFKRSVYRDVIRWKNIRSEYHNGGKKSTLKNLMLKIKYENIEYRNMSSIPLEVVMENVTFPHGLTGIFVSRGAIIGD